MHLYICILYITLWHYIPLIIFSCMIFNPYINIFLWKSNDLLGGIFPCPPISILYLGLYGTLYLSHWNYWPYVSFTLELLTIYIFHIGIIGHTYFLLWHYYSKARRCRCSMNPGTLTNHRYGCRVEIHVCPYLYCSFVYHRLRWRRMLQVHTLHVSCYLEFIGYRALTYPGTPTSPAYV